MNFKGLKLFLPQRLKVLLAINESIYFNSTTIESIDLVRQLLRFKRVLEHQCLRAVIGDRIKIQIRTHWSQSSGLDSCPNLVNCFATDRFRFHENLNSNLNPLFNHHHPTLQSTQSATSVLNVYLRPKVKLNPCHFDS